MSGIFKAPSLKFNAADQFFDKVNPLRQLSCVKLIAIQVI